jgi:hypothetical protein
MFPHKRKDKEINGVTVPNASKGFNIIGTRIPLTLIVKAYFLKKLHF